jgi:DNA-binding NarL/FixJ family response regulator
MTRKILLVTENEQLSKQVTYTALMLTKLNHQVTIESVSGLQPALSQAGVLNTDMIILDLDIKAFNPFEYIKSVRTNEGSAHKKILSLVTDDNEETRQQAYAAGCDSVMGMKEFQTVVSNVLQF